MRFVVRLKLEAPLQIISFESSTSSRPLRERPRRYRASMERVESSSTNESPFGSNLTTPVDEDIQLFCRSEKRLPGGIDLSNGLSESGSVIYLTPDRGEDGFSTAVTRSLSKAIRESQNFKAELNGQVCYTTRPRTYRGASNSFVTLSNCGLS